MIQVDGFSPFTIIAKKDCTAFAPLSEVATTRAVFIYL